MGFMNPPYATGIAGGTEFPPSPNERDCFYRTDLNEFYIYDGTAWIPWRTRGSTIVVAASNSLDPTLADPAYRCDGTADQAEINAAITALPAAGGSVVLREGTYTISKPIAINRDNVMLVGSGYGTLIRVSANVHMIEVGGGATNVIIKDLQVDGSAATGAPNNGIFFHGTAANPITHSRVEGCYVHGNYRYGINLYYSEDCMVVRNRVESIRSDASGILIYLSRRNQVALNDCDTCNGAGIRVHLSEIVDHIIRSERNIIANNRCSSSSDGIELDLGSYNIVVGNYCEDNTVNGIEVRNTSYRNIVIGNYCEHNGTGIEVSGGSTYNMVDGNYCENNGTGIEVSADNNYVVDNYLRINTFPLTDTGAGTVVRSNLGWVTENNVLSPTFAIDAIAVVEVKIPHGCNVTPAVEDCQLTVVEETAVDNWEYGFVKVVSTDAVNVVAKVNVTVPSAAGNTARLALHVDLAGE